MQPRLHQIVAINFIAIVLILLTIPFNKAASSEESASFYNHWSISGNNKSMPFDTVITVNAKTIHGVNENSAQVIEATSYCFYNSQTNALPPQTEGNPIIPLCLTQTGAPPALDNSPKITLMVYPSASTQIANNSKPYQESIPPQTVARMQDLNRAENTTPPNTSRVSTILLSLLNIKPNITHEPFGCLAVLLIVILGGTMMWLIKEILSPNQLLND